jgi:hypothetical protein
MEALGEIIEELVTRSKTKQLNTAYIRAEFHKECSAHFFSVVLPELQRFESHLGDQGLSVIIDPLHAVDKNELQASLIIVYPENRRNILEIRYDFKRQDLGFFQTVSGRRRPHADKKYPGELMGRVSCTKVYDIIETFAASVFGAMLL